MDKNIAALMRNDTKTIEVLFYNDREAGLGPKAYTYVTDDPEIAADDHVVVMVCDIPKCVKVVAVHEGLNIPPNDTKEYKWVVCKVDFWHYDENQEKNNKLTDVVAKAYRKNMRGQFRNLMLAEMEESARKELTDILGE